MKLEIIGGKCKHDVQKRHQIAQKCKHTFLHKFATILNIVRTSKCRIVIGELGAMKNINTDKF